MLTLVSGGSASGKSSFAEDLILRCPSAPRIYAATMRIWDGESRERVRRHRAMRAGKGFSTLEYPEAVAADLPAGCALLVEDLSNLTANEWFGFRGSGGAHDRILDAVLALAERSGDTVVVSNELFSDGIAYDRDTADYLDCLARLNRALAARADRVFEVVCGIPIRWKGEGA